jgi:hypothetical protein
MPIRSIPRIKIGNYPYGQFAGGYIYSLQFTQGYAESVNQIKIDIIYDKNTKINLPDKNVINSYRLEIGDIVMPSIFFTEHSKTISATETIVSCTFIDSSYILDKYYVGLTNRHYVVQERAVSYMASAYCRDCNSNLYLKSAPVQRNGVSQSPNLIIGNLIVVGEEEFVEQACDVPDVKYSFSDLMAAMSKISNFSYSGFIDINSTYKTSYTGTLREVLSNWCSDFGFSFYWDFINNQLVAIDLRDPIDISSVRNFISQNFSTNSQLGISTYSESESLNGTYQQDNIDYILKPSRTKETAFTDFYSIRYEVVTPSDALGSANAPDLASMILAKYNKQARAIYNLARGAYASVGFDRIYNGIETYILRDVLKNVYDFVYGSAYSTSILIGRYDEGKDEAVAQQEATIASDYGKYYHNLSYIDFNPFQCTGGSKMSYSVSSQPSISASTPFGEAGGNPIFPGGVNWFIERNASYYESNLENFNLNDLGPIYTNIDGELADQVRDSIILNDPNNLKPDKYRGMVLIAYKPYLRTDFVYNIINPSEEEYNNPSNEAADVADCSTICEKDLSSEICKDSCKKDSEPGYGLVSKSSTALSISNMINGSSMQVILPSTQPYEGYVKADGTFSSTEGSIKTTRTNNESFQADPNVLQYSININDVTTTEPSYGDTPWDNIKQSSLGLDIKQTNKKEQVSLKIIGSEYGALKSYLNPKNGLINFNIYINDNGIFTDLNFENRPSQKPKPEAIMQTVGPLKMRIIK